MKKCFWYLGFIVLLHSRGVAQGYHFSQFFSTPLWNNPAFTGYTDGPYRIATNMRSQWMQGGTPYLTTSLSADVSPLRNALPEGNRLGVGLALMNDQSLGGALQTNTMGLSLAYNLSVDADHIHYLGVGLQGTLHQRRINYTKLNFENQFGTTGYDPTIPIGEPLDAASKRNWDMNAGVLYNYTNDYTSFFLSAGVYNLLQHNDNVLFTNYQAPFRYALTSGGQTDAGTGGVLYYSAIFQLQADARETTLGAAYGIKIDDTQKQELDLGLWHRIGDALIPYIGYQLNGLQAGLSYDYTITTKKSGSMVKNSFELSFTYQRPDNSELKRLVPWY